MSADIKGWFRFVIEGDAVRRYTSQDGVNWIESAAAPDRSTPHRAAREVTDA